MGKNSTETWMPSLNPTIRLRSSAQSRKPISYAGRREAARDAFKSCDRQWWISRFLALAVRCICIAALRAPRSRSTGLQSLAEAMANPRGSRFSAFLRSNCDSGRRIDPAVSRRQLTRTTSRRRRPVIAPWNFPSRSVGWFGRACHRNTVIMNLLNRRICVRC